MMRHVTADDLLHNLTVLPHLTFEVTDRCNLRCFYCCFGDLYSNWGGARESQSLRFAKVLPLVEHLTDLWRSDPAVARRKPVSVGFYGGEPLLNMGFIQEAVTYFESHKTAKPVKYSMTTNAVLLDGYMDFLVQHGFDLSISIDGDSTQDSYRTDKAGNQSFDKVFDNVVRLHRTFPDYFKEHVQLGTVLHDRNSVKGAYRFLKGIFGKAPMFGELNRNNIREECRPVLDSIYRSYEGSLTEADGKEWLDGEDLLQRPDVKRLIDYLTRDGFLYENYNKLRTLPDSDIHTGTCAPFEGKLFVAVNGDILTCEKIPHCFVLGRTDSTGLSLDLESVASDFNSFMDRFAGQCLACMRRRLCNHCVYDIPEVEKGMGVCPDWCDSASLESYKAVCLSGFAKNPEVREYLACY